MKRIELTEGVTRILFEAVDAEPFSPVAFHVEGREFLRQTELRFIPRPVYRVDDPDGEGEVRQTANGEVIVFSSERRHLLRESRSAVLRFAIPEAQILTGLGQHEDGIFNYTGKVEHLYQHNMKIAIPFLLSGAGYGLLIEADCAMRFVGGERSFSFELDAVEDFSYVVIRGCDCSDVLRKLSALVGKPAMLPKWAFGYIQSKERYKTSDELLETVREFRRRAIGLDCIVLDWFSWREGCWGDKTPDPERFPDVKALTDELHALGARLMVSVWPNTGKGRDHDEFATAKLFLPGSKIYDAFSPAARDLYWEQCRRYWMDGGTDALWCDSCEPITDPDWCGSKKRDAEERCRLLTEESALRMDPERMNAYGTYHLRGLREHWLADIPTKRPAVLSRSGGIDSSALGAILWSGDVCARWEVLEKQVTEGIKMACSGISYWTLDIGAFFVGQKEQWFWRGDYPEGVEDPAYRELYVRWFQFGSMLPMFRSHGTDTPREPWAFGEDLEYDSLREAIRLRYRLMPYIYSTAAQSCRDGLPMMRAMLTAFGADPRVRGLHDCYMFGDALLVKPVVHSLQGGGGCTDLLLPAGTGWYDLFTLRYSEGGRSICVETPLNRFPLFVRAGSILPVANGAKCVGELPLPAREIWVFRGADGAFELYDDGGDGQEYLSGKYIQIPLRYDDARGKLIIGQAQGELRARCELQIRFVHSDGTQHLQSVCYDGSEMSVSCTGPMAQLRQFLQEF